MIFFKNFLNNSKFSLFRALKWVFNFFIGRAKLKPVNLFYFILRKKMWANIIIKKHTPLDILFLTLSPAKLNFKQINVVFFRHSYVYAPTKNWLNPMKLVYQTVGFGADFISKSLRYVFFPVILSLNFAYFTIYTHYLNFTKVVFIWFALVMVVYWLLSGFVFFFKKSRFGKFTSVVQRFWKRSYILFWLLESCLLIVFVYLTFSASHESIFMFDESQVYKNHLFSWKIFFLKITPIVIIITISNLLTIMLKWNFFSKQSLWLSVITLFLSYIIWVEFYQFYHVINFYENIGWNFDSEDRTWFLEFEPRKTRTANHYVMWLLILKFWHLLFVYIFWIFFVLRNWETKRSRYFLLSANTQNLLILYLMSWLQMYPWVKIFLKQFLSLSYSWFYLNNRSIFFRNFFGDLKLFWYGLTNKFLKVDVFSNKCGFKKSLFYAIESSDQTSHSNFKKHFIKDSLLSDSKNCSVENFQVIDFTSFEFLNQWLQCLVPVM